MTNEDTVASGELSAIDDRNRTLWTGTQDVPLLGRPATGNSVQFAIADFYRIANGKVVEHRDGAHSLSRAIALRLVAPPK